MVKLFLIFISIAFSADPVSQLPKQVPIVVSGQTFYIQEGPKEGTEAKSFDALDEKQKESFLEKRKDYLEKLTGVLLKIKRNPGKKMQKIIQTTLSVADSMLWEGANVVVHTSKFGFQVSAGIMASAGYLTKGLGAGSDVGASMSYDYKKKNWRIELTHSLEKLKMIVGFNARFMPRTSFSFFIEADNKEKEILLRQGTNGYIWSPVQPNVTNNRLYLRLHLTPPLQIPLSLAQFNSYAEYPIISFDLKSRFPYMSNFSGVTSYALKHPIKAMKSVVTGCQWLLRKTTWKKS